jgi:hypothetical protein
VREEQRIESQAYYKTLYETMVKISPYSLLIFLNFLLFFVLFPGVVMSRKFPSLPSVWVTLGFAAASSLGDTIGKYSAEFRGVFNPSSVVYLTCCKAYFFFTMTFLAMGADGDDPLTYNDYYPFANMLLLSISNGFAISTSFLT